MEKTKYLLSILLIGIFCSLTLVSAYTTEFSNAASNVSNYPPDNFIGRFISNNILNVGKFTVYGRAGECSINPDSQVIWTKNSFLETTVRIIALPSNLFFSRQVVTIRTDPNEAILINWWRGSPNTGVYSDHPNIDRQFMGEIYLGYGGATSVTLTCDASPYWDRLCYYEIYNCPPPCYDNSECNSGKVCDTSVLSDSSSPFPDGAGICKETEGGEIISPTHKTTVYSCDSGVKTFIKNVTSESINFCNDATKTNYILPGGEASGVCVNYIPAACTEYIPGEVELYKPTESFKESELLTVTSSSLAKGICSSDFACGENSTCIIITKFIDDGYLTNNRVKTIRTDFCSDYYLTDKSFVWQALNDQVYQDSCKTLLASTAQKYFNNEFGFCITNEENPPSAFITFIKDNFKWAALFDVNGDKIKDGMDGIIIIIGVIVLVWLLNSFIGKPR